MPPEPWRRGLARNAKLRWILGGLLVAGCTPVSSSKLPDIGGEYTGATAAGQPVAMRFEQDGRAISAQGSIGDRPVSGSAILGWRGQFLVQQEAGTLRFGDLSVSPDQKSVILGGIGETLVLERTTGAAVAPATSGPFQGRYRSSEPEVWILLTQTGEQLAGHGSVGEQPVALVATVSEERKAHGTLLFADQSRADLTAELSADGTQLDVDGLGATVHLKRD